MSSIPKKLINEPNRMAAELLEGVVAAYHGKVKPLSERGALVKARMPENKVGLLIGGVCGHEPLFSMLIGRNLADGAACGGVYNAPFPPVILETTRAVDRGRGVLYVYGNWKSNRERFGEAEQVANTSGIPVRSVRVWDDVASAPPDQMEMRGGISGDLLVIKVAGAITATANTLDEACAVTVRARDNTRSIAMKLSSGTIPGTGELLYQVTPGEIEIGSRLHNRGAARVLSTDSATADEIVQAMMKQLLADGLFHRGDEVALLINDLGNISYLELLIANRKVRQILQEHGITVHQTFMGSYFTCQETAGFMITLMKLDDELRQCIDMPCDSLGLTLGERSNW